MISGFHLSQFAHTDVDNDFILKPSKTLPRALAIDDFHLCTRAVSNVPEYIQTVYIPTMPPLILIQNIFYVTNSDSLSCPELYFVSDQ